MALQSRPAFRNRILAGLSDSEYEVIAPHLRPMQLPQGTVLREPGSPGRTLYLLEAGMASATALSSDGSSVEVGLAGREGVVGLSSILGHPGLPHHTIMQAAGSGYSIPTAIFRAEFLKGDPLMQMVHDFLYAQLAQASQIALCNRLHGLEARMARWILSASDIIESDQIFLTQEFLAQMMGADRSSATVAAGTLKRAGFIDYRRGRIDILNRGMLEETACECYDLLRSEFQKIYGSYPPFVG